MIHAEAGAKKENVDGVGFLKGGDPGLIRTADKQFRKLLLYPSELRGHF